MGSVAIFTIAKDEPVFLEKWLAYYGERFAMLDTYVLDHHSVVSSPLSELEFQSVHWIPVRHPLSFDSRWLTNLATSFHKFLRSSYDTVVFTAVDEFLVMRDPDEDLYEHLRLRTKAAHCCGYEVVHREEEPALDFAQQPWLSQRTWWYPCQRYSKPIAYNSPIYWNQGTGFARAANISPTWRDEELLLLHLHRIDYDYCLRRHRQRAALAWAPEDRREGPYRCNLIDDPEALKLWMNCNSDDTGTYAPLDEIPENIRVVL